MTREERIKMYDKERAKLTPEQKTEKLFSCWGKEKVSFDSLLTVGEGWHSIIEDLVAKLLFLGWDGVFYQVKEKFGTLRFYCHTNGDALHSRLMEDAISAAEGHSAQYCEACGDYARTRKGGWILTLCSLHAFAEKRYVYRFELETLVKDGLITQEEADAYEFLEEPK